MTEAQHQPVSSALETMSSSMELGYLSPGGNLLDKSSTSGSTNGTPPSSSSLNSLNGSTTIAEHITYQIAQLDAQEQQQQLSFQPNHGIDLIDHSNQHVAERVVEISPNKRYGRLNTLLGKGAFKVVHKAIDHEEGYEVAWNVLHVRHKNNRELAAGQKRS